MRSKYIIGGLVIVAFTIWAGISFNASLTPYVSISDAKTMESIVQVKGERLGNGNFDIEENMFTFNIRDDQGVEIEVVFDGAKPGNFDQASHVVCVGQYRKGRFHAKELLVKCPSKYQEEGVDV